MCLLQQMGQGSARNQKKHLVGMCKRELESWLNMQTKLDLWKVEKKNPEVIPFPVKANNVK